MAIGSYRSRLLGKIKIGRSKASGCFDAPRSVCFTVESSVSRVLFCFVDGLNQDVNPWM